MNKGILKNLRHYNGKKDKISGREIILSGDYRRRVGERFDEHNGTLYGTLESYDSNSITLGSFFSYQFTFNLQDEREHERTIKLFEQFKALRTGSPITLELTDKLDVYIIDFKR